MGALSAHAIGLTGLAGDPASPVHQLDPRAKVLGLVGITLVAVSAPLRAWPVFALCAAELAVVATVARVPPREVWRRARLVLPFVLLAAAALPFVRPGGTPHALGPLTVHEDGLEVFGTVTAKAAIGTAGAVLLGATTTFPAVLRALAALRVPSLFVLIAASMYRYLFVIVAELGRMRAALVSRGYRPRSALQVQAAGRVATALFLRTYGRGERVHRAMLSRGYRGAMPQAAPLRLARADLAFVGLVLVTLVPLRVVAGAAG